MSHGRCADDTWGVSARAGRRAVAGAEANRAHYNRSDHNATHTRCASARLQRAHAACRRERGVRGAGGGDNRCDASVVADLAASAESGSAVVRGHRGVAAWRSDLMSVCVRPERRSGEAVQRIADTPSRVGAMSATTSALESESLCPSGQRPDSVWRSTSSAQIAAIRPPKGRRRRPAGAPRRRGPRRPCTRAACR